MTVPGAEIEKKNVFWVLLPPFLYVVYAAVGFVSGWWILILLLFLLGIGRLYLFFADKLGTKNKNV